VGADERNATANINEGLSSLKLKQICAKRGAPFHH